MLSTSLCCQKRSLSCILYFVGKFLSILGKTLAKIWIFEKMGSLSCCALWTSTWHIRLESGNERCNVYNTAFWHKFWQWMKFFAIGSVPEIAKTRFSWTFLNICELILSRWRYQNSKNGDVHPTVSPRVATFLMNLRRSFRPVNVETSDSS